MVHARLWMATGLDSAGTSVTHGMWRSLDFIPQTMGSHGRSGWLDRIRAGWRRDGLIRKGGEGEHLWVPGGEPPASETRRPCQALYPELEKQRRQRKVHREPK